MNNWKPVYMLFWVKIENTYTLTRRHGPSISVGSAPANSSQQRWKTSRIRMRKTPGAAAQHCAVSKCYLVAMWLGLTWLRMYRSHTDLFLVLISETIQCSTDPAFTLYPVIQTQFYSLRGEGVHGVYPKIPFHVRHWGTRACRCPRVALGPTPVDTGGRLQACACVHKCLEE